MWVRRGTLTSSIPLINPVMKVWDITWKRWGKRGRQTGQLYKLGGMTLQVKFYVNHIILCCLQSNLIIWMSYSLTCPSSQFDISPLTWIFLLLLFFFLTTHFVNVAFQNSIKYKNGNFHWVGSNVYLLLNITTVTKLHLDSRDNCNLIIML